MLRLGRRDATLLLAGLGASLAMPATARRAAAAGCGGTLFTTDEGGTAISAIDLASSRMTATRIPIAPHHVQAT
ncbi:MAG: hypothetical protein ACK4ST_11445, partial [Elioraea tepidiphila]